MTAAAKQRKRGLFQPGSLIGKICHVHSADSADPVAAGQPAMAGRGWRCPKCQGRGDVYYLRAHQPAVEVLGGKRIICPVCAGAGTVRAPARKGRGDPAVD